MKKIFFIISEVFIIIIYIYVLNIGNLPSSIILFQDETLSINTFFGITCERVDNNSKRTSVEVSSNLNSNLVGEKSTLFFKLFDKIILKKVDIDVISNVSVVPLGNVIGLKLYTKGVLVVGMNEIENESNQLIKPYEKTGITEGDMIVSVNNNLITCTNDLMSVVSKSDGNELQVEYLRNGNLYETGIKPEKIEENKYKLGLWVRDSAAGVGTITFYEPSTR